MLVWLDRPDGSWSAGATGRAINLDADRDGDVVVRHVLSSLKEYNTSSCSIKNTKHLRAKQNDLD